MPSSDNLSMPAACSTCATRREGGVCAFICAATLGLLFPLTRQVSLPANVPVSGEGGDHNSVFIVRRGFLREQRFTQDGRRQITALFGPGDIVGDRASRSQGDSIETATAALLCRLPRADFQRLLDHVPDLRRAVIRQHESQLEALRRQTWALAALSPEERLCAFLALSTRTMPFDPTEAGGGTLTMEIARADIADFLGTTPETISRAIHRLDEAGLVGIVDPSHFRIPDLPRLAARGGLRKEPGLAA